MAQAARSSASRAALRPALRGRSSPSSRSQGSVSANVSARGRVDKPVRRIAAVSRALKPAHEAQLLNYLRASHIEVGLLLNFGQAPKVKRMVFENDKKLHLRLSA